MTDITPQSRARLRIKFGLLALIVAGGGVALPMLACCLLPLVGVNQRTWVYRGISWFGFDFAFPLSLLSLVLAIVGHMQPGISRRLGLVALAILAACWTLVLL